MFVRKTAIATLLTCAASGLTPLRAQTFEFLEVASAEGLSVRLMGGGPGCALALSPITLLPRPLDGSGSASIVWNIPSDLALLEATLLTGWFLVDPTAPGNPLGLVNSQATAMVVGY